MSERSVEANEASEYQRNLVARLTRERDEAWAEAKKIAASAEDIDREGVEYFREAERFRKERDEALRERDASRDAAEQAIRDAFTKPEYLVLRADNERLRAALQEITKLYSDDHNVHGNTDKAPAIAHRALEGCV